MKSHNHDRRWTRRGFLRGASLLGMGGTIAAVVDRSVTQASSKAGPTVAAPMGYDLERLRKTDPKLVQYEPVGKIASPREDLKRIVAVPENRLCLAAGKQIILINQEGRTLLEIAAGQEIRCIAVANDGTIYAGLRDSIDVYDSKGQRLNSWRPIVSQPWFTSLACGEKELFVADAANRVVLRLDRSGKLLSRIGEKNKARGKSGWMVPSPYFDLTIGPEGLLWVVNPGYHRLEGYSFEGDLEASWGEPSFGIAGFCGCCNPSYFTRLSDGRFITSEKGLLRIKVYSAKGVFESVVAGPEAFPKYFENPNSTPVAVDVAADEAGRILVADTLANEIRIYQRKKA